MPDNHNAKLEDVLHKAFMQICANKTDKQVAAEIGCTITAVNNWKNGRNLLIYSRLGQIVKIFPELEVAIIKALEGKTQIANNQTLTKEQIRDALKQIIEVL